MKVVITDCDHPDVAAEQRIFGRAGLEVELASCRTEGEVIAAGRDAVALLTQYAPVTAEVLARLPDCRAVGRYGTGVDNVDAVAARARGVALVSVPDYSLEEVANHTTALILTTTGRKSGQPRTTVLSYVRDDHRLLVLGSNFGQQRHPSWSTNLIADR